MNISAKKINFLQKKIMGKNEKSNVAIAINVLYANKEKICNGYFWKNNSNHEKEVILLIFLNGEGPWHYLSLKKLSALLRG